MIAFIVCYMILGLCASIFIDLEFRRHGGPKYLSTVKIVFSVFLIPIACVALVNDAANTVIRHIRK